MKILDKYLLRLFVSTFGTAFIILFFIFILQTVWLFIAELAGKDLDFISVIKFLAFATPRVVPLVLPLSVLLAAIMTFGSLAENYEFAAMKSSGISLQRAMKFLIVFIVLLSFIAFFFANNVIPYAEYKFINFRRNIAQVKPAMAIGEGQFSEVGNYVIKVEKKSGDEGRHLENVTIHKKGKYGVGTNAVIKAESGDIVSNEDSNILKLVLENGNYYEDIIPKKFEERNKIPFAKSTFKKYVINIDLSKLNTAQLDEQEITNTNTMLTVGELKYTLDSLTKNYSKDLKSYVENINDRTIYTNGTYGATYLAISNDNKIQLKEKNVLDNFSKDEKSQLLKVASSTIEGTSFSLETSGYELENKVKNINGHWIAFYDKFVIAFSCLLMFFIGAPLGAIIRKGGLGLPIVFAVMIFIIYHFINTFGKKLAQEDGITPFLGCWMSTLILLPFAVILTKRATEDKGIMSISLFPFVDKLEKLSGKFFSSISDNGQDNDEDNFSNTESSEIITIENTNTKSEDISNIVHENNFKKYQIFGILALVANAFLWYGILYLQENKIILGITALILIALAGYSLYQLDKYTRNKNHQIIPLAIQFIGIIPFYFVFFLSNYILIKKNKSSNQ